MTGRDDKTEVVLGLAQAYEGVDHPDAILWRSTKYLSMAYDAGRASLEAERDALKAENERLKARGCHCHRCDGFAKENERLRADIHHMRDSAGDDSCADQSVRRQAAEAERDQLRGEVRRLKGDVAARDAILANADKLHDQFESEVTRLREGLRRYGRCLPCHQYDPGPCPEGRCTCGYRTLIGEQ